MSKKKWIILIVIGCVLAYVAFAGIVITLFHSIQNNPIDGVAIPYLRYETDIQDEYGEIIFIAKYHLYETEKNETYIKSPYSIETESGVVIVYVTLIKNSEEWEPTSYEVIEVKPND